LNKLYIMSGLPGVGKTTLAKQLAATMSAAYIRIDTVEQALADFCGISAVGEGYELAYRVASDNLVLGLSVVADSCNPIEITRQAWQAVAGSAGVEYVNIEIICSDEAEHRQRIEKRLIAAPVLRQPDWQAVQNREYDAWNGERVLIDTAGKPAESSHAQLLAMLKAC